MGKRGLREAEIMQCLALYCLDKWPGVVCVCVWAQLFTASAL